MRTTWRTRRRRVALVCAVAVGTLAACGAGEGGQAGEDVDRTSPTSRHATEPEATPEPADGLPPFPEGTGRDTRKHKGDWDLVLTDVRLAAHDGFDRIVLELDGSGVPGWTVGYVDQPVLEGSGNVVDLEGEAFLDIYASGTTWPSSGYYGGPERLEAATELVTAAHVGGTFEGYTQVLVGLDGDATPFRVFTLTEPSRLVVDIRSGGGA